MFSARQDIFQVWHKVSLVFEDDVIGIIVVKGQMH